MDTIKWTPNESGKSNYSFFINTIVLGAIHANIAFQTRD